MSFNGPISIQPDEFDEFLRQGGGGGAGAVANLQAARNELGNQAQNNMFMAGMQQMAAQAGVRGMPQRNVHEMNGYENVQDPSKFAMETILPFDDHYRTQSYFQGVVNAYDPTMYKVGQETAQEVYAMGPQAERALYYRGSVYNEVPPDFGTNRLYIALTRQRQDDVYAFV